MAHLECLLGRDETDSFRACLRRYVDFRCAYGFGSVPGNHNGISKNVYSLAPFNHNQGTLMRYVTANYYGWRGGMRVRTFPTTRHFNLNDPGPPTKLPDFFTTIRRSRFLGEETVFRTVPSNELGVVPDWWNGIQVSTPEMSQVTSVEIPYYSTRRFLSTESDYNVLGITFEAVLRAHAQEGYVLTADVLQTAIGEDFNVFFFLGVMPMWRV